MGSDYGENLIFNGMDRNQVILMIISKYNKREKMNKLTIRIKITLLKISLYLAINTVYI